MTITMIVCIQKQNKNFDACNLLMTQHDVGINQQWQQPAKVRTSQKYEEQKKKNKHKTKCTLIKQWARNQLYFKKVFV